MTLAGKGFFIWKIKDCENGDINAIVNLAQAAGFSHLLVKIADGTYSYNLDTSGADLVPPLVQALHARGMLVYGWHYVYGDDPTGEANKAIQRVQQTNVDGYVIDAEREYKAPGKNQAAASFMNRLRSGLADLPIALCSYRFPSYHPQLPWTEFLNKCDFNMPQVYWQSSHNPADQLTRTVNEFQNITPFRPIIPVGSAYRTGAWAATPADVASFLQTAQSLNLSAANFWEWWNCRHYLADVWNAIRDYPWSGTTSPPQDISQQFISALNTRDPNRVANLYSPNAVHVNASRTVQGSAAIRAWYQTLFSSVLPGGSFNLVHYYSSGSSRNFTWTATSTNGEVRNGDDTLALVGDRIAYHYTFFTVS